ncbi:MAG: hypothetical protein ACOYIP_08695 [Coriobacteriales bacterium]|jgi:hypothetical protein
MRLNVQKSKGRLQVGINEMAQEKRKKELLKKCKKEQSNELLNAVKEIQEFLAAKTGFEPYHKLK